MTKVWSTRRSTERGAGASPLAPFSPCTYSRRGLILSHGFKSLLLMPPPGRALFGPLPKPQNPLRNAICISGAWRPSLLPFAGREVLASLAILSGLTPSRISSHLTLTAQDRFLSMTVSLWMAHQRMCHLYNLIPSKVSGRKGACQEPAWEIPPMTKVIRKRPDRQR